MPAILTDSTVGRALQAELSRARTRTDEIFQIVRPEFLYDRPIAERHRIVFYIGHLEAFDWNLLSGRVLDLNSFDAELDRLFAFGIDPVDGGLPKDQPKDWPTLETVEAYVRRNRSVIDEHLADVLAEPERRTFDGFSAATLLNVAIEHRLMHAETLAYMLHQLPLDKKIKEIEQHTESAGPIVYDSVEIPAGEVTLGLPRRGATFGWDNEFSEHRVHVPTFQIDRYMVTSSQFLEFVRAGGYENREFWADENWQWRSESGISHPAFWRPAGNAWLYRTMFEEIPLPLNWPVYVSHAEANAYARWKGKDLPTEAEWQRAAYGAPDKENRPYPWGTTPPAANFGNFDFERWSPSAVNAFSESASAFGVQGMPGNGWEWTATEFGPYPGFEPFPFYQGYSANFFDGKHFVLKGGSSRTAACMLRASFRNWFQSHYQYAYTGFRCVSR